MSDHRHYIITCDHQGKLHCHNRITGREGMTSTDIRGDRELYINRGWVSRMTPQTPVQAKLGIVPSTRQDFCRAHAAEAEL